MSLHPSAPTGALSATVLHGDCIALMREMDAESVDAIVTDPPYGLGFMGREWDDLPPGVDVFAEALRVLKPGGHLLAFGGTRTYHRLAVAVEDAGFEVRDCIAWMYGNGFPKSLDVSKAIDRAAGAEREVIGPSARHGGGVVGAGTSYELPPETHMLTAPATPDAERWQGWGTALKPAFEPIVVARKPLAGTVAANVLEHGTGALNIDGCRIGYETVNGGNLADNPHLRESIKNTGSAFGGNQEATVNPEGRWPANVVMDAEAGAMLDEQTAHLREGFSVNRNRNGDEHSGNTILGARNADTRDVGYGDSGGASRFFYCAKASSAERSAGLDGFEELPAPASSGNRLERMGSRSGPRRNVHPTVKPIDLMRWLIRLVTPPGGTVLDPFTGSGTTGCAAVLEGFHFIGCEREAEYVDLARARIEWWSKHDAGTDTDAALHAGKARDELAAQGQSAFAFPE